MSSDRIAIAVDHRERFSQVPEILARRPEIEIRTATLAAGDYAFQRIGGVERKSFEDFARSLVDGRLFPQMGAMRRCYERPLLILEGFAAGRDAAGVSWPALQGALVSIVAVFGVPILTSSSSEETADLILQAARQLRRVSGTGYVRPGFRPKGLRRRALYILQGLPGIGPVRAARLLEKLGSVRGVFGASPADLLAVRGLGSKLVERIRKCVDAPVPPASPS